MVENPGEVGYNVKDMSRHRGKEDEKISLFLLAVCGITLLMAGCSSKETEEDVSTLELKKNGEIVHTIVEDFGESYYRSG